MITRSRHLLVWALVSASLSPVAGCSSSSGDPINNGSINGGAAPQCHALLEKYCGKSAPCSGQQISDCIAQLNADMKQSFGQDCSGADQTGPTYDQCMAELDTLTCAGASFPAACEHTILFSQ